jgi:hypothetical protein
MAQWKKVLVSGSDIHISSVTASNLTNDNLVIAGVGGALESTGFTFDGTTLDLTSANVVSGSIFSGSFVGDGAGLTGLVTELTVVDESANTGTIDLLTQQFTITGGEGIDTSISSQTLTISGEDATYTNKGIASFNQNQFSVSTGAVSLANSGSGAVLVINGTSNEVDVSRTNGTVTVGLPNDVTITNNLFVGGDLAVNGNLTYINTTDLLIEDKYILLGSGSTFPNDAGIIFGGSSNTVNNGSALIWDASYNTNDGRLGVVNDLAWNATGNQTPDYYVGGVFIGTEANAATAQADHQGNIRIDGTDIYIYV